MNLDEQFVRARAWNGCIVKLEGTLLLGNDKTFLGGHHVQMKEQCGAALIKREFSPYVRLYSLQ